MSMILDGTSGLTSPAAVLTTTPLAVTSGGTGVTTATGSGANVLGTAPTITGATITVAATAAPAFSYYQSSAQTLSSSVTTKLTFTTSEFDTTSGMYSSSRFTPTISGYYQVNGGFAVGSSACGVQSFVYKNGAVYKAGTNPSTGGTATVNCLVFLNGTTDYVEIYGNMSVGQVTNAGQQYTYFQAGMVRSA